MKYFILTILLSLGQLVHAQEDITVVLKTKTLSVGDVPAFVTFIPQGNYDKVSKSWERYLKQETKEKTINENGEIAIYNKEYEKIAPGFLNIYSYIKEYDNEVMLVCALELNGAFISKEMDEEIYIPAKKYIRDFAVEAYISAVEDELKDAEKELKKLGNQKTSLLNSQETFLSEIKMNERNIITKKDEITLNQLDQSSKVIQMQAQKELVLQLANAGQTAKDDAEKILKELEKDFKKLQKQSENMHQDIQNFESMIRQAKIALSKAESEAKFKQLDIDDQSYKVKKIEQKLAGIE